MWTHCDNDASRTQISRRDLEIPSVEIPHRLISSSATTGATQTSRMRLTRGFCTARCSIKIHRNDEVTRCMLFFLPWICSIKFYKKHEVQKLRAAEETNVCGTDLRFYSAVYLHWSFSRDFRTPSARETPCQSSGLFVASIVRMYRLIPYYSNW